MGLAEHLNFAFHHVGQILTIPLDLPQIFPINPNGPSLRYQEDFSENLLHSRSNKT
jgi:hypothetical protein